MPPELREAVHAVLSELVAAVGRGQEAAAPEILALVADTRRTLDAEYTEDADAADGWRLALLARSLGVVGSALAAGPRQDRARLLSGLCELAAVALGWLDTLPADDDQEQEPPF